MRPALSLQSGLLLSSFPRFSQVRIAFGQRFAFDDFGGGEFAVAVESFRQGAESLISNSGVFINPRHDLAGRLFERYSRRVQQLDSRLIVAVV